MNPAATSVERRRAWRAVVGFGLVSLFTDIVADGARSVYGPLLAGLGASAVVVGLITGAAEATSLVLRVVFGPLADRTGRHWTLTVVGYLATAVCLPLLAVTPFVAGAGLALAAALIIGERLGKAVRSPSKTTLVAEAAGVVGRGRGFGVQKALDQVGALTGPLLVAAVVAATGRMELALAVLVVPGVLAMAVLLRLRAAHAQPAAGVPAPAPVPVAGAPGDRSSTLSPSPLPSDESPRDAAAGSSTTDPDGSPGTGGEADVQDELRPLARWWRGVRGAGLPRSFFLFAACAGLSTGGLVAYALIAFHLTRRGVVALAAVPLIFAAAQAAGAVMSVVTGRAYDRIGPRVLVAVPLLVTAVPPLAFTGSLGLVLAGVLCWGAANGLQDSTVKALVADLVPGDRRATAYGVFAAVQGGAAVAGGAAAGWLYQQSIGALAVAVAASQAAALALLVATLRSRSHR